MDIEKLLRDEILIELEVRGIGDPANREITPELKQALNQRLQEEREDPLAVPVKAHEAAGKNPQKEAEACLKKMQEIQGYLATDGLIEKPGEEVLAVLRTKLVHLQGRFTRCMGSPTFYSLAGGLQKNLRALSTLVKDLKAKKQTLREVMEGASKMTMGLSKQRPVREERPTRQHPQHFLNEEEHIPEQEGIEQAELAEQRTPGLPIDSDVLHYVDGDFIDGIDQITLGTSTCLSSTRSNKGGIHRDGSLQTSYKPSIVLSDTKLRQVVSTWKVRFQGLRSSLTIERFLARMEWHAERAQIPSNYLVGVLDLCLEDEALDWFWTSIDRNPSATWASLKQEMIIRFATNRTDDDVRQLMNNRKQQFPRERFQEFYQAILRLAAQASKPISDNSIYTILRRNMRPGLQMAIDEERQFPNLSEFVRWCSSKEEMWRRFGHHPEANLTSVCPSVARERYRSPVRRQVQFEDSAPKVHEVSYLTSAYDDSADEDCRDSDTRDYYQQVCEINNQLKAKSHHQERHPVSARRTPAYATTHTPVVGRQPETIPSSGSNQNRRASCWNCGDPSHFFTDCRKPFHKVFCFGCGAKGVYKLDCDVCTPSGNGRTEMRSIRDPYLGREGRSSNVGMEESASNTDPELYRRWRT